MFLDKRLVRLFSSHFFSFEFLSFKAFYNLILEGFLNLEEGKLLHDFDFSDVGTFFGLSCSLVQDFQHIHLFQLISFAKVKEKPYHVAVSSLRLPVTANKFTASVSAAVSATIAASVTETVSAVVTTVTVTSSAFTSAITVTATVSAVATVVAVALLVCKVVFVLIEHRKIPKLQLQKFMNKLFFAEFRKVWD